MVDVLVIGAGPAGSATAALLTKLGYQVEIWERSRFPRHKIGESLPPRAVGVLKHLGFQADGFAVMEGHTSIWGSDTPHRAVFQDGYGMQVERAKFDQMLLEQCRAKVHFGRTVSERLRDETPARFVVMATGPGKTARYLRQSALFGYWKNSKHPQGSQANDTIIESFPDGWVWSLRLASDLRNVTVVFDKPGTSYEDAIQQTTFVKKLVESAELIAKPIGCDASWQCAEKFAEPGLLFVGDAGSVIDPLSSQGVYKALCSAMNAAIVINTCLKKPELEEAALSFYNDEERRVYDGYSAGSVATFRAEQRWPDRPFWKTRHQLSVWDIPSTPFSTELSNDIETGRADDLVLSNASGTKIEKRPNISGQFIELSDYLVSARFAYGYRGPHSETIVRIHTSLIQPKSVKQILTGNANQDGATLRKVLSYMYKEGLVESA